MMMQRLIRAAMAALMLVPAPLLAQSAALEGQVTAALADAPPGTRFGLVVTDMNGHVIVAVNPDQRFIPASNTKMFTTAAAFAALTGLDQGDPAGGTAVRMEGKKGRDVVLEGRGDARLSAAADCTVDCLAMLADAVAARTHKVHDVIGDDTWFPDERWSPGMSWNNIPTRSGTGISALTLDDNELVAMVAPGEVGKPPVVTMPPYFTIDNQAVTVADGPTAIDFDRAPNGTVLRITGTIAAGAAPERLRLGIDDPAHYAAWVLRGMLRARGVKVTGAVRARHRPLTAADDPANRGDAAVAKPAELPVLLRLTPPPLIEDLTIINKVSQNLHAELMLRRIARVRGSGSIADGQVAVRAMLAEAGVPRVAFDFSDGSGMSTYNRVAPVGAVVMLRWIAAQPWGAAWRATLPVAGVDGTLGRRFIGTLLEGRLFAKTGTLNATFALSGYMQAKSGRTLIFSAFANDVPDGASATAAMDAALVAVAEGS